MKMVRWTVRKVEAGYALGVCFDSDAEGIQTGHDWCGHFGTIREAVEAAYHDGLSAPELTGNEDLRAMSAEDRISASVARIESELANADESALAYPLTQEEVV
jgi:hypothetical protein